MRLGNLQTKKEKGSATRTGRSLAWEFRTPTNGKLGWTRLGFLPLLERVNM